MLVQNIVEASDGAALPIESLAVTRTYSAGLVATETVVHEGNTYVKTYTWSGSELTSETGWVKQ